MTLNTRFKKSWSFTLLTLSFTLLIVTSSFAQKKPPKNYLRTNFSKKEILKDIDYIQLALNIHPSLYDYTSKQELDSKFTRAINQVQDSMSRRDVYNLLAPIIASIKDGHTNLHIPIDYYYSHKRHGGTFFPYDIFIKDNRTYVLDSKDIPKGSEIIGINNKSAKDILNKLLQNRGALLKPYKYASIERFYPRLLFSTFNMKDQFIIKYVDINTKEIKSINVKGNYKYTVKDAFSFKVIKNDIGYLEINSLYVRGWNELKEMDVKIDKLFDSINKKGIKNLIIDIRDNDGGSDMMADLFLKHLTQKPYSFIKKQITYHLSRKGRQFYRKERRSIVNTLFFPLYPFFSWEREIYFGRKDIVKMEYIKDKKPKAVKDSLMFKGKVYAVFNTNTFSSANELANTLKCYNIAETYGTETGCPIIQSGELQRIYTPNVLLNLTVSKKKFWYPSSESIKDIKNNHGVIPQNIIADDPLNFKNDKDPVIKGILKRIESI